jgi:EAL domain-containing protein (putative c-di-GMP-specific phosphodiesterase class I)
VQDDEAATAIAQRVLSTFDDDVILGGLRLRVRASIGVATGSGVAWSTLARDADVAMYEAKRSGGGTIEVHRSAHEQVVSAYRLSQELDRAIDRDELRVWYQPIFDLEDGRCVGAEALVRWQHPTQGLLLPASFIPLAESTGDVRRVDSWVVATATRQVAAWKPGGIWPAGGTLHVNLSPRRLSLHPVVDAIQAALAATDLQPAELTVELTETGDLSSAATAEVVHALHSLGVALALDDFGSHYAVLASLAKLPFDVVKIDRSLISTADSPAGERLLEGIIRLAQGLGVVPVAEGIESQEQLDLLRNIGCRLGQGYLLGRPCPAADFAGAIRMRRPAVGTGPRATPRLAVPSRVTEWPQPAERSADRGAVA